MAVISLDENWENEQDGFIHAVDTTTQVIVERRRKGASMVDGRYLKGALLGEGSYGKVKEMLDVETLSRRAVKILSKRRLRKIPNGEQNVEREIQVLRHLHHKNITELIEVFYNEEKRKIYMVMEYCVCPLQEMLEACPSHKFPIYQAHNYFCQMIEGLSYLHSQRVIHKDIKPGNLLLSPSQLIKICDFGVAEQLDLFNPDDTIRTSQGSPAFQPPEVAAGKDFFSGFKLDVWAAGVTLYNFVSGQYPFMGETIFKLFEYIGQGDYTMPEGLSDALEDLIQGMLAFDYEDRLSISSIQHHRWFCSSHPLKKKEQLVTIPPLTDYEYDPLRGLTCLDALSALHEHDLPQSAVLLTEEQLVNLMVPPPANGISSEEGAITTAMASLAVGGSNSSSPKLMVREVGVASVGESSNSFYDAESDFDQTLPGQITSSPMDSALRRASPSNSRSSQVRRISTVDSGLGTDRHQLMFDSQTQQHSRSSTVGSLSGMGASKGKRPSQASVVGLTSGKGEGSPYHRLSIHQGDSSGQLKVQGDRLRHASEGGEQGTEELKRNLSLPVRFRKKTLIKSAWTKHRDHPVDNSKEKSSEPSSDERHRPRLNSDPGKKKWGLRARSKQRRSLPCDPNTGASVPRTFLSNEILSPPPEEGEAANFDFPLMVARSSLHSHSWAGDSAALNPRSATLPPTHVDNCPSLPNGTSGGGSVLRRMSKNSSQSSFGASRQPSSKGSLRSTSRSSTDNGSQRSGVDFSLSRTSASSVRSAAAPEETPKKGRNSGNGRRSSMKGQSRLRNAVQCRQQ